MTHRSTIPAFSVFAVEVDPFPQEVASLVFVEAERLADLAEPAGEV